MLLLLPGIQQAEICFIKPVTLIEFIKNLQGLKNDKDFSFLASVKNYAKYYSDFERPTNIEKNESKPAKIKINMPKSGDIKQSIDLLPLKKHHSLNSYWKAFRYKFKSNELQSDDLDLFLMLPLILKIESGQIGANNRKYPYEIFAYMFPFGSVCFNMNVKVDEETSFDNLINLIKKLPSASTIREGNFNSRVPEIAKTISNNIFHKDNSEIKSFQTHTMIFIKKTSHYLRYDEINNEKDIRALYACLSGTPIGKVDLIKFDEIKKEMTRYKIKSRQDNELIFFKPSTSLLYADPEWIKYHETNSKYFAEKISCMRNNYQSFFNLVSAVNRFLIDGFLSNKQNMPNERVNEIKKAFNSLMISSGDEKIFFRHALEPVSQQFKLNDKIKEI